MEPHLFHEAQDHPRQRDMRADPHGSREIDDHVAVRDDNRVAHSANSASITDPRTPEGFYLDLLKRCLTRSLFKDVHQHHGPAHPGRDQLLRLLYKPVRIARDQVYAVLVHHAPRPALKRLLHVFAPISYQVRQHDLGRVIEDEYPAEAETMIGLARLDNLQYCITDVLQRRVPGDLIETGVWRGGATIFMRAVLKAYGDTRRTVWVADSFQGLPKPDARRYPADTDDVFWALDVLAVSLEDVKANFARYGLLDDQVRFLVGWFSDTLPRAEIERLSILRLDGDMYESTMDGLRNLYPKLSAHGYVIIDDYNSVLQCKAAVDEFRAENGITEHIVPIDSQAVFWQRQA